MSERNASLGYVAVKKEAVKGTAVVPTIYAPIYNESLATNPNFVQDNAIIGSKFRNFLTLMGNRDHEGDIEIQGDPNILGALFSAFLTLGTETGANPYTHPYTASKTTDPASLTIDISYVSHVVRFFGAQISDVEPSWEDGEMHIKAAISALGCWGGREIASATGAGPTTIVFKTAYDQDVTKGLVVGDTLQIFVVATSTYLNCTVASIVDGTSITVTEDMHAAVAGDFVTIKPATPSLSLLTPFLWGNTQFCFGADATAALAATHTPVEPDSNWHLMHPFDDTANQHRSGSFDPAALPRMQAAAEFTVKKYFDTPEEMQRWQAIEKRACVIRHFVYSGGKTYELRVTLNNIRPSNPQPGLDVDKILYSELKYAVNYDVTDGQAFDVKVLDAIATH